MRAFGLSAIVAALVLASPVISFALLPRTQVCANDGQTVAGTLFSRDLSETSSSLHIRTNPPIPCIWCQLSSATYIIVRALTIPRLFPTSLWLQPFLQEQGVAHAVDLLHNNLQANGDSVLPHGSYTYRNDWVQVQAVNANNHQLTRGVTLSAFLALRSWMIAYGVYGTAAFDIYDGENLVGTGSLELLNGPSS